MLSWTSTRSTRSLSSSMWSTSLLALARLQRCVAPTGVICLLPERICRLFLAGEMRDGRAGLLAALQPRGHLACHTCDCRLAQCELSRPRNRPTRAVQGPICAWWRVTLSQARPTSNGQAESVSRSRSAMWQTVSCRLLWAAKSSTMFASYRLLCTSSSQPRSSGRCSPLSANGVDGLS